MRKAQTLIGQVFVYIVAALVLMTILYLGYKWVSSLVEIQEEVAYETFKKDVELAVKNMKARYGDVFTKSFTLPAEVRSACFVTDEKHMPSGGSRKLQDKRPLFYSAWKGRTGNVFLVPKQPSPVFVEDIVLHNEDGAVIAYCCFETGGSLKLRFEGGGKFVGIHPAGLFRCLE